VPDAQRVQLMQQAAAMQREVEAEASGLMNGQHHMMQQQGPGRSSQHQGVQQPSMSMQQQQQQGSQMGYGGGGGGSMGEPGPHGLLALIQQQQQQQQQHQLQQQREQQLGLMGGGGGGGGGGVGEQHLTPRSLSAHLANGLTGPLGQLAGGSMNEAQLADLTAVINHLEKRQRVGDGPPGLGGGRPASGAGAIQLLSDVADMEKLMQENLGLREELRMMQGKVGGWAAVVVRRCRSSCPARLASCAGGACEAAAATSHLASAWTTLIRAETSIDSQFCNVECRDQPHLSLLLLHRLPPWRRVCSTSSLC
jgi:hypothetical protein